MKKIFLLILFVFLNPLTTAQAGDISSGNKEGVYKQTARSSGTSYLRARKSEQDWRKKASCSGQSGFTSELKSCAMGSAAQLGPRLGAAMPSYYLYNFSSECNEDTSYKKGMLAAISPFLIGNLETKYFSDWPNSAKNVLDSSATYRGYLSLSCSELSKAISRLQTRKLKEVTRKIRRRTRREKYGYKLKSSNTLSIQERVFYELNQRRERLSFPRITKPELKDVPNELMCLTQKRDMKALCGLGRLEFETAMSSNPSLKYTAQNDFQRVESLRNPNRISRGKPVVKPATTPVTGKRTEGVVGGKSAVRGESRVKPVAVDPARKKQLERALNGSIGVFR